VLNNHYDQRHTFISDGPVQKIKTANGQFVHYYDWDPRKLNSRATIKEFREMADGLTKFLVSRDSLHAKEQSFDNKKHGHVLLMVADLIGIAGVATTTDIGNCLRVLGCDSQYAELERYVSLLESMSFVTRAFRSNQTFYVSPIAKSFIRYAYEPGALLRDQKRIKTAIRAALDPVRRSVLLKSVRKPLKKGIGNG
jgi:hypothetical protein